MFGLSTRKANKLQSSSAAPSSPRRGVASPSVIAADMHVLGNIVSDGLLDIDGKIDGNVRCHSATIRPNGRIRGDVVAEVVHVHGVVEGMIKAQVVMLYAGAQVIGTVIHEALSIEDGAFIDGKCKRMDKVMNPEDAIPISVMHGPMLDSIFDNDNDEPTSEAEIRVLENLRLIS